MSDRSPPACPFGTKQYIAENPLPSSGESRGRRGGVAGASRGRRFRPPFGGFLHPYTTRKQFFFDRKSFGSNEFRTIPKIPKIFPLSDGFG